jgi:hypothetical protein
MKKSILMLMLLAMSIGMKAQSTILKGQLVDSLSKQTEPFATVRVYKLPDMEKAVAMSVTDKDGYINQSVKGKGEYSIVISSLGKVPAQRKLRLNGEAEQNLGTILVHDDAQALGEVTVKAQAPLVKMETDKMSYNVQDDVDSRSYTVLEMLRKVPMVTVDGQDNITVNGSSSFKVYVDGKPNPMMSANPSQVFKAMPASMVKNIEVITNPGAKYDAEGAVGVLNLIMNKQQTGGKSVNGYNGNVGVVASTRSLGTDAYVSAQQGKLSISANVAGQYQYLHGIEMNIDRTQLSSAGNSLTHMSSKTSQHSNYEMGDLSMSYDVDSMSTLSASASFSQWSQRRKDPVITEMSGVAFGNGFSYEAFNRNKEKYQDVNFSADFQRFFDKERKRSITLSYLFSLSPSHDDQTSNYNNLSSTTMPIDLTDRQSLDHMNTQEHTVQIDYTTPLSKAISLSTGLKYIGRRNTSDSKYFTIDDNGNYEYSQDASMKYKYLNNIAAAYAEATGSFGKFSTKAGLRYEFTWQNVSYELGNGKDFNKHYGNLVPSFSYTYNIGPTKNIGVTYNMRISRPGIYYLNPYVNKTDPTSISYGNTMLDVEKTHNVGLVFNSFSQKLMINVNLSQSFCNNSIEQYNFYEGTVLNTTYGNIVKERVSSLNIYLNWSAAKNTRVIFNGGGSYVDFRSAQLDQRANGWQGNLMLGLQQTLPWDVKLSGNLMANTKSYSLQGWRSGFSGFFGSLSKDVIKDKLQLSLFGFTGLKKGGKLTFDNNTSGKNFISTMHISVPVAQIGLKITYSFGNMKSQIQKHTSKIQNDFMDKQGGGQQTPGTGMGM